MLILLSCNSDSTKETKSTKETANFNLIPAVNTITKSNEFAAIDRILVAPSLDARLQNLLKANLTKFKIETQKENNFTLKENKQLPTEAYQLNITTKAIEIAYSNPKGLMNGLKTLNQLQWLNNGRLPQCTIKDKPLFKYRGMHLDVSRHFFSVAEIKQYIDLISAYKINYFHWHLTDDQGWRIEIKKYPKIQEIAAKRKETLVGHYNDQPHQFDGKPYGGYYTQAAIKDIIKYASTKGVEIIPEIDIPGHTAALISAYPELSCHKKQVDVATKWGVFFDVLCPTDYTFSFLEDVFDEVMDLFPSKYIHIGGDECPKDQWKNSEFCQQLIAKKGLKNELGLQSYFIKRMESYLNKKGKQIIGWDEILEGGLAPNATVMSWRGTEGGIEAANHHHEVVMTPTSHCYFDYYQSENPQEPLAIGSFIPFEKVYNWNPIPKELDAANQKYIIGGQGNVWTEYMHTFSDVEYMFITRMMTLSEVLWGKKSNSLEKFVPVLFNHINHHTQQGVNVSNHLLEVSYLPEVNPKTGVSLQLNSPLSANYHFKNPEEKAFQALAKNGKIKLDKSGNYEFKATANSVTGRTASIRFSPHIANFSKISLKHPPSEKYKGNGPTSVINGIIGFEDRYGGSEWLGFEGTDFDATLQFPKKQKLSKIDFKFFKGEGQWIYLPKEIKIFDVSDGKNVEIGSSTNIQSKDKIARITVQLTSAPPTIDALRIVVKNYGKIPEGKQGGGNRAWLFLDEIIVQ